MLASVYGVIGGTIVALFFSPVWYSHRARFEVYVDKRKAQNKDVLAAFYKGILDLNSVMWIYQYAKCVQAGSSTKYLETHPITLFVGTPKPSCTADSNFITYDRVLCQYYNFATKRQVYSFTNNNSRLSQYVCNGYRQLSLRARMFNMIYHRNKIPTDVLVVFFDSLPTKRIKLEHSHLMSEIKPTNGQTMQQIILFEWWNESGI